MFFAHFEAFGGASLLDRDDGVFGGCFPLVNVGFDFPRVQCIVAAGVGFFRTYWCVDEVKSTCHFYVTVDFFGTTTAPEQSWVLRGVGVWPCVGSRGDPGLGPRPYRRG